MQNLMFDIDGTLVNSFGFDEACYVASVEEVLGITIETDWHNYPHVTDSGILRETKRRFNVSVALEDLESQVKPIFIKKVAQHLHQNGLAEIPGASEFLRLVVSDSHTSVAIATGGWRETAELKLDAAGIDFGSISIASSNDHHSRIEIMKSAAQSFGQTRSETRPTYFGDAVWDRLACESLDYNFILVGDRTSHVNNIKDFSDTALVYEMLASP